MLIPSPKFALLDRVAVEADAFWTSSYSLTGKMVPVSLLAMPR
jgi:hypothetical protein